MAKNKTPAKPILATVHDFKDSLDALLHQSMMFHQAVQSALELEQVSDRARPLLQERADAFKAALMQPD